MSPTHPSNDNRPAEFDAQLVAMLPALHRSSYKFTRHDNEELVHRTILSALEHWTTFRPGGKFLTWLLYIMQGHVGNDAKTRSSRQRALAANPPITYTPPPQEHAVGLHMAMRLVAPRYRSAVLAVASGRTQQEAANDLGASRDFVRAALLDTRRALAA